MDFKALEVLTHELVHVADKNESGHRGRFARIARRIGLEGKLTQTHAGKRLESNAEGYMRIAWQVSSCLDRH